jgi:hypothetical protein
LRPIAEAELDVRLSRRKMWLRLYAPRLRRDGLWACRYTIDYPVAVRSAGVGETSLQAIFEALRGASRALYGSTQYRSGRLGLWKGFGRDLVVPATSELLDVAPFPF